MKKINILKNANPFTFKGGIGRVTFLLSIIGLFLFGYFLFLIGFLIYDNISPYKAIAILKPYLVISVLLLFYITVLCHMKRLYDIIADKQKSIFYIISLYIVVTCLELLPGNLMSTLGKIISIGALISFLLIPGKTDDVE